MTPAIAALEAAGVPFRVVRTEIARSAEESAAFQGIELGSLLRSILVRRGADDYLFVLVPGRPPVRLAEAACPPRHEPALAARRGRGQGGHRL